MNRASASEAWLAEERAHNRRLRLLGAVKRHMGVEECTIGDILKHCEEHPDESFEVEA